MSPRSERLIDWGIHQHVGHLDAEHHQNPRLRSDEGYFQMHKMTPATHVSHQQISRENCSPTLCRLWLYIYVFFGCLVVENQFMVAAALSLFL